MPDETLKQDETSISTDRSDDFFDVIGAEFYTIASMLVGEGEDSIRLVESAVANADVVACDDADAARKSGGVVLCGAALDLLTRRDASGLAAPLDLEHASTCLSDDELDAVGISGHDLGRMIAGPNRNRLRAWLESLPTAMRTIFVLRAVGGLSAAETARLLKMHGGPNADGWGGDDVRELYRQGLCSLASQVLHSANR